MIYRLANSIRILLCIFAILTGSIYCAPKSEIVVQKDEKEILGNRIREYWQYQISGKVEKAYQCEFPEYREKTSLLEYVNRFKMIKYQEAEIIDIMIKGKEGESQVDITYTMLLPKLMAQKKLTNLKKRIKETWVNQNGYWYHLPEGFEIAKK